MTAALPTRIGELSLEQFRSRLRGTGLGIRVGPFDVLLKAEVRGFAEPLRRLYLEYPVLEPGEAFSFHLALRDVWRFRPRPCSPTTR